MSDPVGQGIHPLATEHWPIFLTAPGETDVLLVAMAIFMVATVIGIGVFYFKLHSLPEQMAHRGQKVQFEIVAVLGLLSLFTHNHLFWIAGLLLAFVPLPDFSTPLTSMAQSLGKMAGGPTRTQGEAEMPPTGTAGVPLDEETTPNGSAQVPLDNHRPTSSHGS
jgi:hypothetical protein